MDITQLLVTPIFVMFITAVGGYLLRDRFDRIDARLDRIDARLDTLPTRAEFEARVGRLEAEVAALRSDLTQIALAVGARLRPQTG